MLGHLLRRLRRAASPVDAAERNNVTMSGLLEFKRRTGDEWETPIQPRRSSWIGAHTGWCDRGLDVRRDRDRPIDITGF